MTVEVTKIKFAPFGIGIHSMDSDKAKELANRVVDDTKRAVVNTSLLCLGYSIAGILIATEVVANSAADAHESILKWGVSKNVVTPQGKVIR